jgi:DNA-binding CsgD family transcriptional regulator
MEYIAKFEISRTNKILGTDFKIVENWFGNPFFSWDGVKERITSLRVWLAVSYVFISFGWSIFSFILVSIGIAGLFVFSISLGILTFSNFSRSFEVIDNGSVVSGSISLDRISSTVKLTFGDAQDSAWISWDLTSHWFLVGGALLVALALWIIPRNARAMAGVTEGLLSGTYLPQVETKLKSVRGVKKVSERAIRDAMDQESLQPQLAELSSREREILALMAQGKSNAGIAKSLYITEGSVEKHVSNILSKLELKVDGENHRRVLAVLKYLGIDAQER